MKMLDEEQPRWLHKCVGDKQKMICFLALGVSKCHRAGLTFQAVQGLSSCLRIHSLSPYLWTQRSLFLLLLAGTIGPVGCIIIPCYHFRLEYMTFPNVKIPSSPVVFQFIKTLYTNFLKLRNAFIDITARFITVIPAEIRYLLARYKSFSFFLPQLCAKVWIGSFFHGDFRLPYFQAELESFL